MCLRETFFFSLRLSRRDSATIHVRPVTLAQLFATSVTTEEEEEVLKVPNYLHVLPNDAGTDPHRVDPCAQIHGEKKQQHQQPHRTGHLVRVGHQQAVGTKLYFETKHFNQSIPTLKTGQSSETSCKNKKNLYKKNNVPLLKDCWEKMSTGQSREEAEGADGRRGGAGRSGGEGEGGGAHTK